jgi:N-methylhydantoinase A
VEVISVGAGGGSIGWIDSRGVPQVGPRSAGSLPGPACYGKGGTEPTTTDAAVVLGIIDPATFLAGRRTLDAEKAAEAVRTRLAQPLQTTVEEAAAAMHRLTVATMSDAVRSVTVERGRDPREFAFCAYGGALGMFAAEICRSMRIGSVIIPRTSSVFSAHGLLATDDVRNVARSVSWKGGEDVSEVRDTLLGLERDALAALRESGYEKDQIDVEWQADLQFVGQLHMLSVPLPHNHDLTAENLEAVRAEFAPRFESEYGGGTAWQNAAVILEAVRVIARGRADKHVERDGGASAPASVPTSATRRVYQPEKGDWADLSLHDATHLDHGVQVDGPAIVEHPLTTIVVPNDWRFTVDPHGNYRMQDLAAGPHQSLEMSTTASA